MLACVEGAGLQANGAVMTLKALVTGGHNGIGHAIRKQLQRLANFDICYSYDIENGNDVCDYAQARAHVRAIGHIDLLVNCAGVCKQRKFAETSCSEYTKQINVNLIGTMNMCHAALPFLKDGDIINIASRAGAYGHAGLAAYCASKAGVMQFSEALALDLRELDIRVGYIMPGTVATGLGGVHPIEDWQIPPDDVGRAVVSMWNMPRTSALGRMELKPSMLTKGVQS